MVIIPSCSTLTFLYICRITFKNTSVLSVFDISLARSGLQISHSKLIPPDTWFTCLGIEVNTITRSISIPSEKLLEIKNMCTQWTSKSTCTKRQLQSLLGSLLYITKCIRPARISLNRMLQVFETAIIPLQSNFHKKIHCDLNWFPVFLQQYNGVTFFDYKPVDFQVHLDASLSGLGGVVFGPLSLCTSPRHTIPRFAYHTVENA